MVSDAMRALGVGLAVLALGCTLLAGMARAQQREPQACSAPPVDAAEIRRTLRTSGFDLLMRQMAKACPDIALIFASVMIGPVPRHDPRDWLLLLPFAPADLLATQDF